MGPWLTKRGIAGPLSEYITRHVLPLGSHKGEHHCFGPENFVDATRRLASVAGKAERNEKKPLNGQGRADLLLDLLDDKFSVPFSNLVITR